MDSPPVYDLRDVIEEPKIREDFHQALLSLPGIRTPYMEVLTVFSAHPMTKRVLDQSAEVIDKTLGKVISDFDEPILPDLETRMGAAVYLYKESAYFAAVSSSGENVLEIRPWSRGGRGRNSLYSGVYLFHIPYDFSPAIDRSHKHSFQSVDEYRLFTRAIANMDGSEKDADVLIDGSMCDKVRSEIEIILRQEWALLAGPGRPTPGRYAPLLDVLDPFFRTESQPLYAQRHKYGICVAVVRPHGDESISSFVAYYVPDRYRFSPTEPPRTTGLGGILSNEFNIPMEDIAKAIDALKADVRS